MFPNEGGQKHPVRERKYQWGNKEKDCCMAESEKEPCVK